MYAGKLVEIGNVSTIFNNGAHPYSKMFIRAFPSILGGESRITPISGIPPNLANPPTGCRFHPRCPIATKECEKDHPPFKEFSSSRHRVACYHAGEDIP